MRTKLFIVLLAIGASIGTIKAAIFNGTCGKNLTWMLNTKTGVLTIEGKGDMTYNTDYGPWLKIDNNVYAGYIKCVNLPDGLTSIAKDAFRHCRNLTTVNIPNSVKCIETQAFYGCSSLTSIEIPNSVTRMGTWVFCGCENLTSVTLSNGITTIGQGCFDDCTRLKSITIPQSVTKIEERAFFDCGLTSIVIPKNVTYLGCDAFGRCPIKSFTIYAVTPPSIPKETWSCDDPFHDKGLCILYVPESALETYDNTLWWENFKEIKAIK